MAENLQQNIEQKGPFSPLQSGCAFVMLSNMLIYLGVVAFTFNLLDPSKLDASYLAKRGFTARPAPEREEDKAFRQMSEEKREEQQLIQTSLFPGREQEPSSAARLSEIGERKLDSSRPQEPEKPKAALTQNQQRGSKAALKTASTRLFSLSIFPQSTLGQPYSVYQLPAPRPVVLETYQTIPVEIAPGINFPAFSLPSADSALYLYRPPNPVPEASRGGFRISSPPVGAQPLNTNSTPEAGKQPPAKDPLKVLTAPSF